MKRKSVDPKFSMCVQPSFIIGTNNEDGSHNFAPITWVSATCEGGDDYLLVISMFGTKRTKQNVIRTGLLSVNLVNREMLPIMDYFGSKHAKDGEKNDIRYGVSLGVVLDVPTLNESPWVYKNNRQSVIVSLGNSVCLLFNIKKKNTKKYTQIIESSFKELTKQ